MVDHNNIANYVLLSVLAAVLLIGGCLQYLFDTQSAAYSHATLFSSEYQAERVNDCHPSDQHHPAPSYCQHKACHQAAPLQRDLGGPEFYSLVNQAQPLNTGHRQTQPLQHTSSAPAQPHWVAAAKIGPQTTSADLPAQSLILLRATVLLC